MNEKVEIEICKRKLTVELEGLTPLEIRELARRVHEEMARIASENTKIADSSKLAILTALSFAAENYHIRGRVDTERRALDSKLDEVNHLLRAALHAAKADGGE